MVEEGRGDKGWEVIREIPRGVRGVGKHDIIAVEILLGKLQA